MIYNKRLKKSLIAIPVSYEDIELNSPTFFNITYTPSYFTAGKNIIKYNPNFETLSTENPIEIEILDSSGNTIYHSNLYYEEINGSNVISAYVYQDVSVGECTITFIGTRKSAFKLDENKLVRYTHRLDVNLLAPNRDDIIYTYKPVVSLSERKYSILEEKFTSNKNIIVSGSAAFQYLDGKNILFCTSQSFSKDFENGILSFPNLSNTHFPNITESTNSFSYSASVVSVNLPSQMELDSRPVVTGQSGVDYEIVESYNQPYILNYYKSSTDRNVTQNIKNYIKIDIDGLEPSTGYVSRIKVLGKSKINPASDYKTLYDYRVNQNNILIDSSSDFLDFSIGEFKDYTNLTRAGIQTSVTKSAIDYWNVKSINSAPTASKSFYSSNLFSGITITTATTLSSSQYIMLEQTGSSAFNLYNDTLYLLQFDYLIDKEKTTTPTLNVYMSGSATFADTEYGKYLGGVDTSTDHFSSFVSSFTIPIYTFNNGNGILKFLISEGIILQNIRVEEVIDRGFTPNRTTLYVPIDQNHKSEYWDFVIKYFNDDYKEANIDSSINNIFIEGGNQYIYGDDNIITGSTFLSPYSSSGIQLFGNISGSKSGSTIQSYGYKGIDFVRTGTPITNNYGWGLTQGNPYTSASYSYATVQMINQSGSSFEFRSNPDAFNMNLVGQSSTALIGVSSSISQSYLKWDGSRTWVANPIVTNLEFRPTTDPDPTGGYFTSSFLFASASNTPLGYDLYFRQDGNLTKLKWFEAALNSGILFGGSLSYSGSYLYVQKGSGVIVNHNASLVTEVSPIVSYVQWNDITASMTNIATSQNTFVYLDTVGNLQQQTSTFTPTQYHNYIPLGRVSHYDYANINSVASLVETTYDANGQQSEFIRGFGPLKLSGMGLSGQTGTLRLNVSSGTTFNLGGFYQQNPEMPSTYDSPTYNTSSIVRIYRSGSGYNFDNNAGSYYTVIDPTQYDNGSGVLQPVGNNNWSVQRVFFNPLSGRSHVYYGQAKYTTLLNAINAIASEPFTESDITAKSYTFVGFLAVLAQTTNLTNTSENTIVQAGLFRNIGGGGGGGTGGGSTTLAALTDVSLGTLSNAEVLKYNSTSGKWENSTVTTASYSINAATASTVTGFSSSSFAAISSSFSLVSSSFSLVSSSLQGSASYSTTASYVNTLNQNVKVIPPSGTDSAIYVSGSNTVGGSTYVDFLKVSNTTSPVTHPNKSFRLDNEGSFEIIDSEYANTIWSLTDTGIVRIPSAAGKTTQLRATGSVITFNTSGGQIFDDGNFHIHSLNPNANLWLNASGSGKFVINAETGATGGVCIGTSTQSGYVTINGSVNATYSYAYLANLSPTSPTGYASGTNPYSLTANQRIQASEFDATSDERLKNIIGKIKLSDAIRLIKNVEPIQFTWKDEIDKGIKTGYSAQQLIKTGFEHMVGGVPSVGLEETVDNDGFISPKDTQLVVNTDQITAYHSLLIQHLLERIEELEKKLLVSNN